MVNTIQIFNHFIQTKKSTPDTLNLDNFNINEINENFVISRDFDGNIISRYKENIWNFEPYKSNPSQQAIFNFEKSIHKNQIQNVKQLMLLIMIYGNGRDSSQYSVGTLKHYFISLFKPLSIFAFKNKTRIKQCLESKRLLMQYINTECTNRQKVALLLSLLSFLHYKDNNQTKINYQHDDEIIYKLHKMQNIFIKNINQTAIIPIRILSESLSQRWEQIEEIEQNIEGIKNFLKNFIASQYFASSRYYVDKSPTFKEAIKQHKLKKIFEKYHILNRRDFLMFITNIQGTCCHLIYAYTGMRKGEVLSLKNHCIKKISYNKGVCYIVSNTSKLAGRTETAKWVTSKETKKVVKLIETLNKVVTKKYNKIASTLPLFISFSSLLGENPSNKIVAKKNITKEGCLPLDNTKLIINQQDKEQIKYIDYIRDMKDIIVGEAWSFKSHQYRRSLVIYSLQSGLVSLGTLQKQLKHTFREMTLYYANGTNFTKKIFDFPKEHIANDFNKLKPEVNALVYIRDVLFSNEKLYGTYGGFIEKNKNYTNQNFNIFLVENREKIIKKFQNGEMAYKETALGACVSLEACDSILTRSLTACTKCHSSILKKSKLENAIKQQKIFLDFLDKDSVEYRTELDELGFLKKMLSKNEMEQ